MPRGKCLSVREKGQIDAYHDLGLSNRAISRKIERSLDVVNRYIKNPGIYGTEKRSGRKPKVDGRR